MRINLTRLFIFFSFIFIIVSWGPQPARGQDKLEVGGDLAIESSVGGPPRYGLILEPQSAFPPAQEGKFFYRKSNKKLYYYDGMDWIMLGGMDVDRYVATKIVAASDSLHTDCSAGPCSNSHANYTCDGTDDQVTIQQAIDALGSNGGAVYLLEGTYNISGSINLNDTAPNDSGKAIIGTGKGTVLKVTTDANNVNVINASGVSGILISQLMIDGNAKTGNNNRGINFYSTTYSKIDNVWVENVKTYGIVIITNSNSNTISSAPVQNNSFCGIYVSTSNNNILSKNNVQSNTQEGIYLASANNTLVSGNNMQGNTLQGMKVENSSSNIITNNNMQNNGKEGIYLNLSNQNTLSGNNVQGNSEEGIFLFGSSRNAVSDNNVKDNSLHGIYLSSASSNMVTGNVVYNNGVGGAYDGIKLDSNSDTNLISSNRLYDSVGSGYGINISANTCDNSYIVSNLIDGAGYTGLIQDSGTNTKYTDKAKITLEKKEITGSGASYTLDVATYPRSYVVFNRSSSITTLTITNGKSAGDLLILENISPTYTVTVKEVTAGNVNLSISATPCGIFCYQRVLGRFDTLKLIWNGSKWLEVAYANN